MNSTLAVSCLRDPLFAAATIVIVGAAMALSLLPGIAWQPHWPGLRTVVLSVCVYPLLEEIVFRGGLQAALLRGCSWRVMGLSAANAAASVLFALAHWYAHPPAWALATLAPSILFGMFYERHGQRLRAPITLHCLANAAYFGLLA